MHIGLQNNAIKRRADVDTSKLIFGGDLALDQFADLVVDLAKLFRNFGFEIPADLQDLKLGFGDLPLNTRDRGDELSPVTFEPRCVTLELCEARYLDQIAAEQHAYSIQLDQNQLDLF